MEPQRVVWAWELKLPGKRAKNRGGAGMVKEKGAWQGALAVSRVACNVGRVV